MNTEIKKQKDPWLSLLTVVIMLVVLCTGVGGAVGLGVKTYKYVAGAECER